jgi:adenylosuccinate lyase
MPWREAHDLLGRVATDARDTAEMFYDVLMREPAITNRIEPDRLRDLTDPLKYLGRSKEIVRLIADKYHKKRTFPSHSS